MTDIEKVFFIDCPYYYRQKLHGLIFLILVFQLAWPDFLELKLFLDSIRPLTVYSIIESVPYLRVFSKRWGGAKAGTKLIYNGKIEKLKKIWMEIIYIWPWESLYWYAINAFYLFFQYKYHAIFSNHSVLGTKVR